jgi:hypothetical protein
MERYRIDWFDVAQVDALDEALTDVAVAEFGPGSYAYVDGVTVEYLESGYSATVNVTLKTGREAKLNCNTFRLAYSGGSMDFVAGMFDQAIADAEE